MPKHSASGVLVALVWVLSLSACSGGNAPPAAEEAAPDESGPPTEATRPPAGASIEVDVQSRVDDTAATDAFTAFVEAHAASVNAGEATPGLKQVTSAGEFSRQRDIIAFAGENGYLVPDSPRVAIVSSSRTHGAVELGVCVWLPSTEYVDEETSAPPSGPVPKQWAPATATLALQTVTWVVDTVTSPLTDDDVECRGLR